MIFLLNKYNSIFFISPHFDDAALSAGSLLTYLAGKKNITVITVFSECGDPPYTLSEKAYFRQCGYSDLRELYKDRKNENQSAFKKYSIQTLDMGYAESMSRRFESSSTIRKWLARRIPEFNRIYPTYRFHTISGHISPHDYQLKTELTHSIRNFISSKESLVVCPLGIGNNVDHLIVREACREAFASVLYWADYPYHKFYTPDSKFIEKNNLTYTEIDENKEKKRKLILTYRSQIEALFKNEDLSLENERYYYNESNLLRLYR